VVVVLPASMWAINPNIPYPVQRGLSETKFIYSFFVVRFRCSFLFSDRFFFFTKNQKRKT